jgi:ABC-2 type transport system ATP-binding protein
MLGRDIRNLSHGYRQRVGLGQALVHDPPILILDEPTSDLDPNEKAEVIRYIKEIGKERTILLSTHNLSEVEAACARAIIVSKGRVVADGPLDDIRAKSGKVRYVVSVDDTKLFSGSGKAPGAEQIRQALMALPGITAVSELPTDDRAHKFQLLGARGDIRPELFRLIVDKGWLLLELRRDSQSLEDVFKLLTKGDERNDRGRSLAGVDDDDEDDAASSEDEDDDDADENTDGDDDDDDDADDTDAQDGAPTSSKKD